MVLTSGIARATRHADQQPLAFERLELRGLTIQCGCSHRRRGSLWVDELAKTSHIVGAHHVVGEVGGDHRCGADQQDGEHFPTAELGALCRVRCALQVGHAVDCEPKGMIVGWHISVGSQLRVGWTFFEVGQFETRHKELQLEH